MDGGFFRVGLGSQCFFRGGAGGDGVFFSMREEVEARDSGERRRGRRGKKYDQNCSPFHSF